MAFTFRGGIHPNDNKEATEKQPVFFMEPPKIVRIPLSQHIGAPCQAIVDVGETVSIGQKIGDSKSPVSAPIHASVSGIVKEIVSADHPGGAQSLAIAIENDFQETMAPIENAVVHNYKAKTPEELMNVIREGGCVGMGGATFPTHIKLSSGIGKVDTLIINAAECEPYLTADHREILEMTEDLLEGAQILRHILGLKKAIIAIEENKPDAIKKLNDTMPKDGSLQVAVLKTKYPQGGEKQIISALTGREVPPGKLPADVGCAVFNVDTAASVCRIVTKGTPIYQRIVTVSGDAITKPSNVMVRIGTSFRDVIDACAGLKNEPFKVISGGPMMGVAQWTLDVPVIKGTSGILALSKEEYAEPTEQNCIRCGRCLTVCPVNLMPTNMFLYATHDMLEECDRINVSDCIECGSCSYICPSRLHLVQNFRVAKLRIGEMKRKQTPAALQAMADEKAKAAEQADSEAQKDGSVKTS